MTRTYVVTGSASGIGRATAERLRADGHVVIGADRGGADVDADLATTDGRRHLREAVTAISGGTVDGVIAVAGTSSPNATAVGVNYFGALATLSDLRPLLSRSAAPRAVVVSSLGVLDDVDAELLQLLEAGDEAGALARADHLSTGIIPADRPSVLYTTSKLAIARWVRRNAPREPWAGSGIALNAVAPGLIDTAMSAAGLATPDGVRTLTSAAPAPFNGPIAPPSAVANLLVWLAGEQNQFLTGQVIFIDGGAESMRRPELV